MGAGKSEILCFLKDNYNATVLLADQVAHLVYEPGGGAYQPLIELLGSEILDESGHVDKKAMSARIFADEVLLKKVNELIHPAVKNYILQEIAREKALGEKEFFFIEAALLIEEHYETVCDELWYVYAKEEVRIQRLMASRGYSEQKCRAIMEKQLSEEAYRLGCTFVIDNSYDIEEAKIQIRDYLAEKK